MARKEKNVTKTISTHNIEGGIVTAKDGKIELKPFDAITVVDSTMNDAKAMNAIRRSYGKLNNYVITNITSETTLYTMPLRAFMELAKKTSPKTNENEVEG